MDKRFDIAVLVGSLRRESLTRRLVAALGQVAPPALRLDIVNIGDMPHYNQDLEATTPPSWAAFRNRIRIADGVLFATPEYNRSIPGVLKNALDVGSRPYGSSVWARKPAAVVSASPGAMGGFGANHHLRQPLVFLDMPTLQQPEMYFANIERALGTDDAFTDTTSRQFGEAFMTAFEAWVTRFGNSNS